MLLKIKLENIMNINEKQFDVFIAKMEEIRIEIKSLNLAPAENVIAHGEIFSKEEFKNNIKDALFTALELKTCWGRNEIKTLLMLALEKI